MSGGGEASPSADRYELDGGEGQDRSYDSSENEVRPDKEDGDAADRSDDELDGNVTADSRFRDVHGSTIETAGIKYDSHDQYQFFMDRESGELPARRELTPEDFESLGRDKLLGIDASIVVSREQLEPVVECLERHRVVFVVGERGVGKGALSQVAAGRIVAMDPSVHEALISSGLDRDVRVKLETILERSERFVRRILLFEDAFDGENQDMERFVKRLDEPRLEVLEERLEAVGSYLLLTSEPERLHGRGDQLQGLGILTQVSPPGARALLQLLHQRKEIRRFGGHRDNRELDDTVEAFLESKGEELAGGLRTVPRMVYFVDHLLALVAQNELSIEEAFDRMDGLEHWLLSELPPDLPTWSFVLALVLASTDPRTRWIPWFPLHYLWREVEDVIDKTLGREKDSGPKPLSRLVVDQRFLSRARAQSRRLDYPLGEAVRFKDPAIADRLWRALLDPGRSIVSTLLPRLKQLVGSPDPSISVIAARALGRIGELDPRTLGPGRFEAWFDPTETQDRFDRALLLGEMLVGAAGSDDRPYFSGSLEQLQGATGHGSLRKAERALVAFVPLGTEFPESALEILGSLIQRRLSNPEKKAVPLGRKVQERLDALARSKNPAREDRTVQLEQMETENAALEVLDDRQRCILGALQFALVGICFGGEPIAVLEAMRRWMRPGIPDFAPWIAFLSLRKRGVLGILEDFPLVPPPDDGTIRTSDDRRACSRILLAGDEDEAITVVAEFLEAAYKTCEAFPLTLRSGLRRKLVAVLGGWMKQGASVDLVRPCTIAILARLLDAEDESLRKKVFDLIQQCAGGKEDESRDLALDILRAGAPGARGTRLNAVS